MTDLCKMAADRDARVLAMLEEMRLKGSSERASEHSREEGKVSRMRWFRRTGLCRSHLFTSSLCSYSLLGGAAAVVWTRRSTVKERGWVDGGTALVVRAEGSGGGRPTSGDPSAPTVSLAVHCTWTQASVFATGGHVSSRAAIQKWVGSSPRQTGVIANSLDSASPAPLAE